MPKRIYVLDGRNMTSLARFFEEVNDVLELADWGRNLNAFNDILRGGFGTPPGGFVLKIAHSDRARASLGYAKTAAYRKAMLENCHPSNQKWVREEIAKAKRKEGPTLFDEIIDIIKIHCAGGEEARDGVELVLA